MQLQNIVDASDEQLREVQLKMLEILNVFSDFCRKHNLTYWLAGGTMIGAIRHSGFIPWDDDIDIFMPRKDYNMLLDIFNKEHIDTKYKLGITTENDNYHLSSVGLHDTETTFINKHSKDENILHGIYLDIMPIDYAASGVLSRANQILCAALFNLFIVQRPAANQGILIKISTAILLKLIPGKKNKYFLAKFFEKKMLVKEDLSSSYMVELVTNFKALFRLHKKELLEDVIWIEFEKQKYPIPIGYHEYLTACFGNYMEPPPFLLRKPKHETIFVDTEKGYENYRFIYYCVDS